jgi:uncharacterized alpha-E superfamily protein
MLADDGWRFCEIGQMIERAVITANSVVSISKALCPRGDERSGSSHATEIELSAFLRLLGCRDAYRRIFQMRAEPGSVLELLWQHPQVPRSIVYCLRRCGTLLRESTSTSSSRSAPAAIDEFIHRLEIHTLVADSFLNHQAHIAQLTHPRLL